MDRIQQANAVIQQCEDTLRVLIDEAMKARDYEDVTRLARLAADLAALRVASAPSMRSSSSEAAIQVKAPETPYLVQVAATPNPTARRAKKLLYPRFERQGERLVKIGWSKKEKVEYEHRAPFEAVRAVAAKLSFAAKKSKQLQIEDVLGAKLPDGTEVPSYQAYLVLAWLRNLGIVERLGNDGYRAAPQSLDESAVEQLLNDTAKRGD